MTLLNVFRGDAFSAQTLTAGVDRVPYKPQGIGAMNLFTPKPILTKDVVIEDRNGTLTVIPTSERGTTGTQRVTERRNARFLTTPRLRHEDTIRGDELQDVRAFGEEAQLVEAASEISRRISGPTGLQASMELTWERHRLGALNGLVIDADGSTIYDFYSVFGLTRPTTIFFDLGRTTATGQTAGNLRKVCNGVVRGILRSAQGMAVGTGVAALCGDGFWDDLIAHPDVERTYLNQAEASELRQGTAFGQVEFGGITWMNYRGTDDNSTVAVPSDNCRFFPTQAPEVFQVAYSPGETLSGTNQRGRPLYINRVFDTRDDPEWVKFELSSYPLHMCVRPEVLRTGSRAAS